MTSRPTDEIVYFAGDAIVANASTDDRKVIAHVVNNSGGWGRGFVVPLGRAHPLAEASYRNWAQEICHNNWMIRTPETFGLGLTQFVTVGKDKIIANMCAQDGYATATNPIPLDYDALTSCIASVFSLCTLNNASLHMPRIGCGLGGAHWDDILTALNAALDLGVGFPPTYVYDLP